MAAEGRMILSSVYSMRVTGRRQCGCPGELRDFLSEDILDIDRSSEVSPQLRHAASAT